VECAKLKMNAINRTYSVLISKCFKIPNASY